MSKTPPNPFAERPARRIAVDLLVMLVINTIASLAWYLLSARPNDPYYEAMIFSQCVGFSCYSLSLVPKRFIAEQRQRVWMTIALMPLGVFVGLSFGGLFSGHGALQVLQWTFANPQLTLSFSLAAALTGFTIMWSRDLAARRRAELEARAARAEAEKGEAARALASAELAALQAQIEPHFLFNTLANMRSLIGRDPELAQQLLDRLITYLRSTLLTARAKQTTLGGEFELLDSYLDIQRIRMGGRFSYQLDLPIELAAHTCPPLMLQPLVENAIRHGIEPKVGNANLKISAAREGEALRLQVEDDGVGFGAAPTAGTGVGLANVRSRLAALFGDAASMAIESPPGGGVRVQLLLPGGAT